MRFQKALMCDFLQWRMIAGALFVSWVNYVRNATEEVYILGRGFTEDSSPSVYTSLIKPRKTLQNGVEIVRIHAGNQVAAVAWAQGYAEMLEEFPHRFDMRADLDGTFYNDVILVDPHGNDPVVACRKES